ncbi:hypothetical protein DFS34DRAFT_654862 [Phlyctochytrium arcticum]|nr:hypothetical protein DFS34DRAFT_654862 [Phlyctochytrium arcticum]
MTTTSTNALESYHWLVKANKNGGKHSGILKACCGLRKVNKQRRVEADRSEILFREKTVKNLESYPQVAKFPHPAQQLLIEQIMAVEQQVAKGKAVPAYNTLECQCKQFQKEKVLTEEIWANFALMFEETRFEIYEQQVHQAAILEPVNPVEIARNQQKRKLKAAAEELSNYYFQLEDKVACLHHGHGPQFVPLHLGDNIGDISSDNEFWPVWIVVGERLHNFSRALGVRQDEAIRKVLSG